MRSWAPTIVATLALLVGLGNGLGLMRVNARLNAFERAADSARAARHGREEPAASGSGGAIRETLARFGEDEGIDQRTMARVVAALEERVDAMALTREDLRSGEITPAEAREELEELRAASDDELLRILGERRFHVLEERLAEHGQP